MVLRLAPDGTVTLHDADDVRRFHLAGSRPGAATMREEGIELDEDLAHAWVEPDAVRRLAGDAATPEWRAAFDDMVAGAAGRGWTDERGRLRAHTEWS